MVDEDTFITELYVMSDDYCKTELPAEAPKQGPEPALTRSEVLALAVYSQWYRFRTQRDFYRYAEKRLKGAFPTLPNRTQFNRQMRAQRDAIASFGLYLAEQTGAHAALYEVMDTTGVPVRNVKRRGAGWLAGLANIGFCTRLGWFNGFRLLLSANPQGIITGFGFAAGSAKDQPIADTFLALRAHPHPAIESVGRPVSGCYVVDTGFEGQDNHLRWLQAYHAELVCSPKPSSKRAWPKPWRRWLHSIRQIIETVIGHLFAFFRLENDRPHELSGFQANLAAKVALHNFCIWLNKRHARPALAFADLLDW
jgi:hypothetical protein